MGIMKKPNKAKISTVLFGLFLSLCSFVSYAQYDINSFNYGLSINKILALGEEAGLGARVEYAFNCSTTFLAEV